MSELYAALISYVCNKKPGKHTASGFKWFFENDNTWCELIISKHG